MNSDLQPGCEGDGAAGAGAGDWFAGLQKLGLQLKLKNPKQGKANHIAWHCGGLVLWTPIFYMEM